jgi:hypothetical protein
MVNVVGYLMWVSLGSGAEFTRVVPFRHARPHARCREVRLGRVLSGLTHPPLPTDQWAPTDRGSFLSALSD